MRASPQSATIRPWLYLAAIVIGVCAIVYAPLRQQKHEAQVKRTVMQLQRALLAYHDREEIYIARPKLSGGELAAYLRATGDLKEPLVNPYGPEPYAGLVPNDGISYTAGGTDWLEYALEGRGRDGGTPIAAMRSARKEEEK